MDVKKTEHELREMFVFYLLIPFVLFTWAWGFDGVMWFFVVTFFLQLIFGEIHAVMYVAIAGLAVKAIAIDLNLPFANFLWGFFYSIIYWWIYYQKHRKSYEPPLN